MKRFTAVMLCILLLSGCAHNNMTDADTGISETTASPTQLHHIKDPYSRAFNAYVETDDLDAPEVTTATEETTLPQINEDTSAAESQPSISPPAPNTEPADSEKQTEALTQPVPVPPSTETPPASPEEYLRRMSTEELVGQMILARHPAQGAANDIQTYHLGGYILFAKDFEKETPDTVRAKLSGYQSASKIPMLFAIDEEGGTVTRVSRFAAFRQAPFPSPRELYNSGGMYSIQQNEREKARLLRSIGINANFAPVCDITTDSKAFMYNRSLGQSPEITADFVRTVLAEAAAENVGCVLKHFPGYGNNDDTHTGIARDGRSKEELFGRDLVPFQAGINSGVGAILVSHTIIEAIDPATPATLSPAVHSLLRNEMNFNGVIVTDDLSMQAVASLYGKGEAAVLAVLAGNDILCSTDYKEQYLAVLNAVNDGRIPIETVKSAALRILKWKKALDILN